MAFITITCWRKNRGEKPMIMRREMSESPPRGMTTQRLTDYRMGVVTKQDRTLRCCVRYPGKGRRCKTGARYGK